MAINTEMTSYAASVQVELTDLIRKLCAIPAPSYKEQKRAEFVKNWFEIECSAEAYIDEALNVICPVGVTDSNDVVAIMAHTDTVFPDTEPMPFKEENGFFYCPGVTDDTAQLAVLMVCAKYFIKGGYTPNGPGILFIANSCEEGLGNLKGSRMIVDTFPKRLKELITIDGSSFVRVTNKAVGSRRYSVTVRTEGGHSFTSFGNRNAIHCLASMIDTLYSVKVPEVEGSKTTYNVGIISGGTSVNTIAQEASMMYEYRSDNTVCLEKMRVMFEKIIEAYRATGIEVDVKLIGDRPCSGSIDKEAFDSLVNKAAASIRSITGKEPIFCSGSTDCNYPLYKGIPAVCIGGCAGGGCHTREEYLDTSSLYDGCRLILDFISNYFDI